MIAGDVPNDRLEFRPLRGHVRQVACQRLPGRRLEVRLPTKARLSMDQACRHSRRDEGKEGGSVTTMVFGERSNSASRSLFQAGGGARWAAPSDSCAASFLAVVNSSWQTAQTNRCCARGSACDAARPFAPPGVEALALGPKTHVCPSTFTNPVPSRLTIFGSWCGSGTVTAAAAEG